MGERASTRRLWHGNWPVLPAHIRPLQLPYPGACVFEPLGDLQRTTTASCIPITKTQVLGARRTGQANRAGQRRRKSTRFCYLKSARDRSSSLQNTTRGAGIWQPPATSTEALSTSNSALTTACRSLLGRACCEYAARAGAGETRDLVASMLPECKAAEMSGPHRMMHCWIAYCAYCSSIAWVRLHFRVHVIAN